MLNIYEGLSETHAYREFEKATLSDKAEPACRQGGVVPGKLF